MNIFVLDKNPIIAAQYHCDKHVVKMIVEYGQLLCTAVRLRIEDRLNNMDLHYQHLSECQGCKHFYEEQYGVDGVQAFTDVHLDLYNEVPYRKTHVSHPCTRWTTESYANFHWLSSLFVALLEQYRIRYGRDKKHATEKVADWLTANIDFIERLYGADQDRTPFAQAMPDEYKDEDAIVAYRTYYHEEKAHFAKWSQVDTPYWWMSGERQCTTESSHRSKINFTFNGFH